MVDWIALIVSHGLIAFAFWRLIGRDDLDDEKQPERRHRPPGFGQAGTPPDLPAYDGPERRGTDASPARSGWRDGPSAPRTGWRDGSHSPRTGWRGDA